MNTSEKGIICDINDVTGYGPKEVRNRPDGNSYPLSNVLLQTIGHHHGSLHSLSDDFCLLFDIPTLSKTLKAKTNDFVAEIQDELGKQSVEYIKTLVLKRLRCDITKDWQIETDESWANRAKRQSKVAYGLVYEPHFDAFIDYNVTNINCMRCSRNIPHSSESCSKTHDGKEISSDKLGWECSKQLIHRTIDMVLQVNEEHDKSIALQVALDNDTNHSDQLEIIKTQRNIDVSKLDDINHALKGIKNDWKAAKATVVAIENEKFGRNPNGRKKACRIASNVISDTSCVYARKWIGRNLIENPQTFGTQHVMAVLDHMFAGEDHTTCPDWCKKKIDPEHITILPRGKYYDRNKETHQLAYDTLKPLLLARFSNENCQRLHGLPRTNGNEV